MAGDINLDEMKSTDFSNPMYDAIGTGDLNNGGNGSLNKAMDNNGRSNLLHDAGELFEKKSSTHPLEEGYSKFSPTILSPSSGIHKSPPNIQMRQTALNPNSMETDKDTAHLVEEDRTE